MDLSGLNEHNEQNKSEADLNDVPIDQGYCLEAVSDHHPIESPKNNPEIEPIQTHNAVSKPTPKVEVNPQTDPLKNPLAYFSSLVSKLELGTLDLQAFSSNTERAAKQYAAQYEQLQQQIDTVTQTYLTEYEFYKPLHKQIIEEGEKQGLNYWGAADKLQLSATVRPMIEKLDGLKAEADRLEAEQEELKSII